MAVPAIGMLGGVERCGVRPRYDPTRSRVRSAPTMTSTRKQRPFESRHCRAAGLALSLVACAATEHAAPRPATTPRADVAPADSSRGFAGPLEGGFTAKTFALSLRIAGAGSDLVVEGWEVDPGTGEDLSWEMTERHVGATIERAAARHANEWFVAPRQPSGELEVERWTLEHTVGAPYSARPTASTGIGVSVETPATESGIEQLHYVRPSKRPRPLVTKSAVIRGLRIDPVAMMVVDPDGRFVVLIVEQDDRQRAVQVALIDSSSFVAGDVIPLWDFTPTSDVRSVTSIAMLEEASTSRRALALGDVQSTLILWDAENDGVHERHEILSISEQDERYPWETWRRSW
jgi:hypothetical protein